MSEKMTTESVIHHMWFLTISVVEVLSRAGDKQKDKAIEASRTVQDWLRQMEDKILELDEKARRYDQVARVNPLPEVGCECSACRYLRRKQGT